MKKNPKKATLSTWVQQLPIIAKVLQWSKKNTLPGLQGVLIYDVTVFMINELHRDVITIRSRAIAFSFLLALFPGIIFLFTLLPYVPIERFDVIMLGFLAEVLPENAYELLQNTIEDLLRIPRGGLLSIGFLLAVIFASNGVFVMLNSFRKMHAVTFKQRSWWMNRLVALKLTAILFGLLVLSISLIIAGRAVINQLLTWMDASGAAFAALSVLRWLVIFFLFYSAISAIYRYGPPTKEKFKFFSPGAFLATILSILSSILFSLFVNNFGQFNEVYGSIGTLIVSMIWLNINSLVVLVGFELNASIAVNRDLKQALPDEE
ncbi:MAG: YihY/virulence factor BrkB family protein [Bacteroidota bacterium]